MDLIKARPEREGFVQDKGPERRFAATETISSISQAMPASIIAALVATAWIGSGLRARGSSTTGQPEAACVSLDETARQRRDQIGA